MITVTQYLHYPNNTELGKGNTHECYLLVPNTYDLSHIFPNGKDVEVTDVTNQKKYYLKSAWGREFRINQMGQFYRDYDVHMGDEIILTHVKGEKSSTYISVNKHNRIVIKQGRNGAEIINLERLTSYKHGNIYEFPIVWAEQELTLNIQYKEAIAKRSDSPDLTDYYTVKLGNNALQNGSYLLTLGEKNELTTFEKTDIRVFSFDESIISNNTILKRQSITNPSDGISSTSYLPYLTALRTKPFMLLAGISGTGKSRIVKELAFMTCPNKEGYNNDKTTPGNYCLIEVKPNWHDSSELLGYYNALDGTYELTPFIRFAYRALQRTDVPFFVCLDEMNLAPVEQYFAEYLSVLETRTKDGEEIISAKLIKKEAFNDIDVAQKYKDEDIAIAQYLQENGLPLPSNLYIIGTVNMDDTTHQFSRKVIDRAFTIEMNGGKLEDMFKPENANALQYRDEVVSIDQLKSHFVNAEEVFKDGESDTLWTQYETKIKTDVPARLKAINDILKNTPFQVSYRVQNELILYLAYLIEEAGFPEDIEPYIGEATLAILMEKILPRIQGDDKLLGRGQNKDVFTELSEYVEQTLMTRKTTDEQTKLVEGSDYYRKVIDKLDQMHKRLENSYFANFF